MSASLPPSVPSSSLSLSRLQQLARGLPIETDPCAQEISAFLDWCAPDTRTGTQKLIASLERKVRLSQCESERIDRMGRIEGDLMASGLTLVAGVDEVGRGALAGPIAAAAVILPSCHKGMRGVDDSKKLSAKSREDAYERITGSAIAWSVAYVSPEDIDARGITWANRTAMETAVRTLSPRATAIISDAVHLDIGVPCRSLVGADAISLSVAAASIVAKVSRDRLMVELSEEAPGYGIDGHKGYGSPEHIAAIRALGPSAIHRMSFLQGILQS